MQFTGEQMLEAGFTEEQIKRLLGNTKEGHKIEPTNIFSGIQEHQKNTKPISMKPMAVTTLHDLQTYTSGSIVKLPDFAEGQPLIARMKRPSMLALAAHGQIPNSLLTTASQMFTGDVNQQVGINDSNVLKDMYDICHTMAEATLVEPTLAEIEGAGLELTDEQLMAIFNYTQAGIKALENFR